MSKGKSDTPKSYLDNLIDKISIAYKYDSWQRKTFLSSTLPSKVNDEDFNKAITIIGNSANVEGTSEAQKQNLKKVQNVLSEIREFNKSNPNAEGYTTMVLKQQILKDQQGKGRREY
jgi:hypothetical protein